MSSLTVMPAQTHGGHVKILKRFIRDESGATTIDYGLITALISIATIAAYSATGGKLSTTFNDLAGNLSS